MTEQSQNTTSAISAWFSNGPWRSKSVAIALLVSLIGVFFWISDVNKPSESENVDNASSNSLVETQTQTKSESSVLNREESRPLPGYAKFSVSYIVGCFIGWFFRKLSRLVFVICAISIALLALGKFVGAETHAVREGLNQGAKWTQDAIESAKATTKFAMPSAAGFGIGMFIGFRRRRRV